MLKHKPDSRNILRSILLFLLLFSVFIIVGQVGSTDEVVYTTYYASDYSILNGTDVSGSVPSSVTSVDADYFIVRSEGTDASVNKYNPSGYTLLGSTSQVLGSISNLTSNDGMHMVFSSYFSGLDMEDYVDNNTSDVDGSSDKGIHSDFIAQKNGPDLINDILTEEITAFSSNSTWLYVSADDETRTDWTRVGTNPYLNAIDYPTNFVNVSGNNLQIGDFNFADSRKSTETINSVTVQLYAKQSGINNNLEVFVWDGSGWASLGIQTTPTSWGWMSWTATTVLDTWTKIDGAKIYLVSKSAAGTFEVDCARLSVDYADPANCELDLEVQWTSVDFDELNEELCIYGGSMGAENIRVDVWNFGWENLFADLNSGWNNVSITSYLDSSTFTIRFKGGIETSDTTQDAWNIDACMLRVSTPTLSQPFNWFTTLLYVLPFVFGFLFLLALLLKRKKKKTVGPKPIGPPEGSLGESKPKKPDIAKKTDAFSGQFGVTHQQIVGKKMLLEIDPASDYHESLLSFVSEAKNNNEPLFIFTNKNSTLHSMLSGTENVNFRLLTSKTSSPQQINNKETLLPASDLSILLDAFGRIQTGDEKPINVLFDNLSNIILSCGFEKAYKFMCLVLETISSPKATSLFVFNPTAHDQTIRSSIRGLFRNQLAHAKSGPKIGSS